MFDRATVPVEIEKSLRLDAAAITPDAGMELLRAEGWDDEAWLWSGFSTRTAQRTLTDFNLGFTAGELPEQIQDNRKQYAAAITGRSDVPIVAVRQVHSDEILVLEENDLLPLSTTLAADGLITRRAGVLLGILTADCVPVLIADRRCHAVGAFHAGWRGTVAGIVEAGVRRMQKEFGSDSQDLLAAIGPCIGACCYAVGEEVRRQFETKFAYSDELFASSPLADSTGSQGNRDNGTVSRLNLVAANRRQLLSAGLSADSIRVVGSCTNCDPRMYYSHRASGERAGRMMAVVGIR